MKNIIVPTDFSVTARGAFRYAKELAKVLESNITVIHIEEFSFPIAEFETGPLSDREESRLANEAIEDFVEEEYSEDLWVMNKTTINTQVIRGSFIEKMVSISEKPDTGLIVLGATGYRDFLTKIIGSNSLELAKAAFCPVLLVPRDTEYRRIERIMYASNYHSSNPRMIREIAKFASRLNAAIHFVHVESFEERLDNNISDMICAEMAKLRHPGLTYEIHNLFGADVIAELKNYSSMNRIDLMAFASKKRGFWSNLMHTSITENVSVSSDMPMLVMHSIDEA